MHLATTYLERYILQRPHAPEVHGDMLETDGGGLGRLLQGGCHPRAPLFEIGVIGAHRLGIDLELVAQLQDHNLEQHEQRTFEQ